MNAQGWLQRGLEDYERAAGELEGFKGKLVKAQADEELALCSSEMSDSEVSDAIEAAQRERRIFTTRSAAKESALEKLLVDLKSATSAAQQQISEQVRELFMTRRDTITADVLKVLQPDGLSFDVNVLHDLLETDSRLIIIRKLEVSAYIDTTGNVKPLIEYARILLETLKQIQEQKEI